VAAETIVLVTAASAIGIAAAAASIRFVPRVFDALPRLNELQLDGRAIAVAIGTSLVAALLVGVWPVLSATRGRVTRHGLAGRGTTAGAHGLQRALVVVQVALSLLLAGAAALLGRSYYNLTAVPSGFDSASVWTFHVGAQWNEDRQLVGLMQERIVGDLATVPGVEAAGLVNFLPMSRATLRSPVLVAGVTGPERDGSMNAGSRVVSDGYFRTLQVPIEAGENCPSLRMDFDAPRRVLINRRFADDYAPGQSLVGREMRVVQDPGAPYTIVGIVNDMAEDDIDGRTSPYIYTCDSAGSWPDPEYVVRTSNPSGLAGALREVVRRHAPSRAIFDLAPLDDVTAKLRQTPRLNAAMLALFSSAALVLASIGLYSLFTLLVAEQVREIGVRLALGATPSQMIGLVASSAGKLLAGGLVIGGALIVALQRFIVTQLFGVSPLDPWSLTMAALVLGAVSLAAVLLPAARAGRVSPMVAMTAE
jgi:putative ABC transport system permease protein